MTTIEQLQQLPIDQLDRMAFGVQQGVQELPVDQIQIQYQDDYDAALDYVEQHPTAYQDALLEPVEVDLTRGVYWLQSGHRLFVTAQVLGLATILVDLTIRDNPVKVLAASLATRSAEITCAVTENPLQSKQGDYDEDTAANLPRDRQRNSASTTLRCVSQDGRAGERNTVRTVSPVFQSRAGRHAARSRPLHGRRRDRGSTRPSGGPISRTRDGRQERAVARLSTVAGNTPRTGLALNYEVVYTPRAVRNLRRLDKRIATNVTVTLPILEITPRGGDGLSGFKALKGYKYLHSIRVGGPYRLVYAIFDQAAQVEIQRIETRDKVYKKLKDPKPPHLRAARSTTAEGVPSQMEQYLDHVYDEMEALIAEYDAGAVSAQRYQDELQRLQVKETKLLDYLDRP